LYTSIRFRRVGRISVTKGTMKIYTKAEFIWTGTQYILDKSNSVCYDYSGCVELACGASSQQTAIEKSQQDYYNTMTQQAQEVFGEASQVFKDLNAAFAPIVAAGPNQQGFSAAELSNLNSQAITNTGQAYQNAKEAVGEREAAYGGGNLALPSGARIGADLGLAESAANQTSGELSQINQADYATGRQNFFNAAGALGGATGTFNPATGIANATTGAGSAAANTANQIASENNSWVNATIGALGGVAGAAVGNIGSLGSAFSGGGGGNNNGSVPGQPWA
jgi:hypothetical protein